MFGGFKLALAGGIAIALIAGLTMVYNGIRAAERDRINAELARQKAALAQQAEESLQSAQARIYAARNQARKERENYESLKQTLAEIDMDSCVVSGDAVGLLRSIGSSAGSPAASE